MRLRVGLVKYNPYRDWGMKGVARKKWRRSITFGIILIVGGVSNTRMRMCRMIMRIGIRSGMWRGRITMRGRRRRRRIRRV